MRTQFSSLAVVVVLLCPITSAQWVQTSLDSGSVECFLVSGTNLFAGTLGEGVFVSTDDGTTWTPANSGLTYKWVYSAAVIGTNLFAGTNYGVFRSTNDGTSWTAADSGLIYPYPGVYSLGVSGSNLFAGTTGAGVFLSSNNGTSWNAVNSGLTAGDVWSFAVSGTNLFVGTSGGVFLSTNNGTSWAVANTPFPDFSSMVQTGNNLFAGTSDGVFLSTNRGTSWNTVNSGLTDTIVNALAASGTNLFAGTGRHLHFGAVFFSTNNGTSWTQTGLMNTRINCLAVSGVYLSAGTDGDGVWRRPLSEMVSVNEPINGLLASHLLEQNYPNPFNPSTTIKYELPKSSRVTLSVYDMLGREVSVLVNERKEAGVHEVKLDGSNLASGVYFYRLQAGDFTQTKRLLLLR